MKWSKEGFADPFRVRMGINSDIVMLETSEATRDLHNDNWWQGQCTEIRGWRRC